MTAANCRKWFWYTCPCVWSFAWFFISLPLRPPLFSIVYQCGGCLSSRGMGAYGWVVRFCQPSCSAVSILKLAANGGSSRTCQTSNLHIVTQLLTNTKTIQTLLYLKLLLQTLGLTTTLNNVLENI